MNPGSRQPTVLAGAPAYRIYKINYVPKKSVRRVESRIPRMPITNCNYLKELGSDSIIVTFLFKTTMIYTCNTIPAEENTIPAEENKSHLLYKHSNGNCLIF